MFVFYGSRGVISLSLLLFVWRKDLVWGRVELIGMLEEGLILFIVEWRLFLRGLIGLIYLILDREGFRNIICVFCRCFVIFILVIFSIEVVLFWVEGDVIRDFNVVWRVMVIVMVLFFVSLFLKKEKDEVYYVMIILGILSCI